MGSKLPKQFIEIGGKPIVVHTIDRFLAMESPPHIILVLPENYKEWWKKWCFRHNYNFRHQLASGGITRFHSVKSALEKVSKPSIVAVHDAVRPLVATSYLERLFQLAQGCDALIPVLEPVDSIRVKEVGGGSSRVDRANYLMVQTPQLFKSEILIEGYSQPYLPSFTDDASVVEPLGVKITTTNGERHNIKITESDDLLLAQTLINALTL